MNYLYKISLQFYLAYNRTSRQLSLFQQIATSAQPDLSMHHIEVHSPRSKNGPCQKSSVLQETLKPS